MGLIISISVIAFFLIVGLIISNQIIAKKNQVAQAFGSIEIYLKKRFDLIPNLIALLNKYLAHEKGLLMQITELRNRSERAKSPDEKVESSNKLTQMMSGLNINVEDYPDLKADIQFSELRYELSDIEDQISAARRTFNSAATVYNNKIQMFPASVIAGFRKDQTQMLLEIPIAEQKEIDVNSLLGS